MSKWYFLHYDFQEHVLFYQVYLHTHSKLKLGAWKLKKYIYKNFFSSYALKVLDSSMLMTTPWLEI